MDNARKIERLFYNCPEINIKDTFPFLDEDDYMGMCSDFSQHSSEICMYIFVRRFNNHVPFVDIYVWSVANLDVYDRFVICDGFRLPEELETKYLEYAHNQDIYISDLVFHEANTKIIDAFPQWHYKDYKADYLNIALQHLYFASHASGPRETLFKADGLEYIAANIDKVLSYNIMGTTPSAIIEDIPLKLLRILNREAHFDLLCDQTSIDMCKAAYNEYCSYFGKDIPSVGQWNYILELYKNDGFFGGYPFKKEIYRKASNFVHPNEIEAYKQYFSIRRELNIPGKFVVPDFEEIWSELDKLDNLVWHKKSKNRTDRLISERKTNESYRYEYTNKTYEIVMPSCTFDLYWEAVNQHNCIADYISTHAEGDTTILFLRKKANPDESFVTMEVRRDAILQVYGTCNKLPDKDVYEFIVEYAKARRLSYDMKELIIKNIYTIDERDSVRGCELIEFALHDQFSIKKTPIEQSVGDSVDCVIDYHQMDMNGAFTDIFEQDYF